MDEIMFHLVSGSSRKSYNYVKKLILKYCFEADNNQRVALTEWALKRLGHSNPQRYFKKGCVRLID